jgi:enoyl-CoA hydratase/carnithine racemase
MAAEIATRSPDSVAGAKALFQRTWVAREAAAFRAERQLQARVLLGENQRTAMKAAMKKTEPTFGPRSWWMR